MTTQPESGTPAETSEGRRCPDCGSTSSNHHVTCNRCSYWDWQVDPTPAPSHPEGETVGERCVLCVDADRSCLDPVPIRVFTVDVGSDDTTMAGLAAEQVWCVVYDSETPMMDGSHPPLRMADQSREQAKRNYDVVLSRSKNAPKRNLRIETRFVTPYRADTIDGSASHAE